MTGLVIKLISNKWTVLSENKFYDCASIGKLRHLNVSPVVGDKVLFDDKTHLIKEILPRTNALLRPPVANVSMAVVVTSCKEPEFSQNLLDKMLTVIEYHKIKPVICFSKYDLLINHTYIDSIIKYYRKIGYTVFLNTDLDEIKHTLKGHISVLTGQTGVGKSSLLNHLKKDLNLPVGEISKALGRGKHTTRHVELLNIDGCFIADSPGFSSLDFTGMTKKDIKDNFIEINKYGKNCKYQDCNHIKEVACAVKEMVLKGEINKERYDNYVKFYESVDERKWPK